MANLFAYIYIRGFCLNAAGSLTVDVDFKTWASILPECGSLSTRKALLAIKTLNRYPPSPGNCENMDLHFEKMQYASHVLNGFALLEKAPCIRVLCEILNSCG